MELSRFDSVTKAEAGAELVLVDPVSKTDTGAAIILYGADSAIHKSARKEIDARNKALGRTLSLEEQADQIAEILARCTKGWRGITENGKDVPFSQAKAKEIYVAYPEIHDRVATFVFTRANFFGSASGS
ncbi:MAG: hypothetical protein EHM13_13770 [Acidobacteria bacterium]|nr:MAG: hypothetical protein EHM13_13770 [Acidobacteriota bacterium]